jgi:biuret amidohydrolase
VTSDAVTTDTVLPPIQAGQAAVLGLHWLRDIVYRDGAVAAMYGAAIERAGVLDTVSRLFAGARAAGCVVAHTRVCFRAGYADMVANAPLYEGVRASGGLIDGTPGAEVVDELAPQPSDIVVGHNRVSGFADTSLDLLLRARGVDTLLMTGVATNITVESTARYGSDLGYRVVVVSDCCVTDTDAAHRASLDTLRVLAEVATSDQVLGALR